MSNIARVLDCDGTITDTAGATLLERLMLDFYKQQPVVKKMSLAWRSVVVRSYRVFAQVLKNFSDDKEMTGETNSLKLFDLLMLRQAKIPVSFMEERAKEYAQLIKPKYIQTIKNCKDDVYIVSAEPMQLLNAVLKNAGLSESIAGVYGTRFEIAGDKIKKLSRGELVVGVPGKHAGMVDIISNGYSKIHAIGDSAADIGLFKTFRKKVVPYTFIDAAPELVEYVRANNGKIVTGLEEFFSAN